MKPVEDIMSPIYGDPNLLDIIIEEVKMFVLENIHYKIMAIKMVPQIFITVSDTMDLQLINTQMCFFTMIAFIILALTLPITKKKVY